MTQDGSLPDEEVVGLDLDRTRPAPPRVTGQYQKSAKAHPYDADRPSAEGNNVPK